jgi:hypothetical protein
VVRVRGLLAAGASVAAFACVASAEAATGPDSTTQPLKDGCQRNPTALIAAQTPEWVYVNNTPADQPAPPAQWVAGTASSFNPAFEAVHTSGADLAFGHDAYDFNLNLLVDAQYDSLLGTANYLGNGEETQRLHTEMEDTVVPKFAWPEPGDRVMEKGSWVWDCGHWGTPTNVFSPDYDLPHEGQPCPTPGPLGDPSQCTVTGERTEFHPWRALWVQRQQSPDSPLGESQGELFVSTDKTKAGKVADCAHKHPPPPSPVLPNPVLYGADYRACVESEPNWQDVTGDYSFFLPAPPRPSPGARLTYRAVNHGSVNAPQPTLTPSGDGVQVSFHLDSPPTQRVLEAYTVYAGWSPVPTSTLPTHLRVTFDSLTIHRAMDPGCSRQAPVPGCQNESTRQNQLTTAPGDWNLFWDVNGHWGQWLARGHQPASELLVDDGDVLNSSDTPPGSQTVDLYVPQGKGWRLFVHGRECDINAVDPLQPLADCPTNQELADDNDVPGKIVVNYSSAQASLGEHTLNGATASGDPTSTCPNSNADGCYSLKYTVRLIDDRGSRVRP